MVRIIAGTLMKVGMGVYPPEHMEEILEARDRQAAGPTAPARGLTLISMEYEKELRPVITGENKHWSYQLIQQEVMEKKKAYLVIERCEDEFFDALYEEPLDRWYEIGNVITIVDAGLEETLSRSGNERNRVKYDFIHHTHTQQPVDVVRLFRSDFCQIADVCCGFPPFVKHRYGIIRCDMIKGVFPYLIDAAIFKAQFLIRFAT